MPSAAAVAAPTVPKALVVARGFLAGRDGMVLPPSGARHGGYGGGGSSSPGGHAAVMLADKVSSLQMFVNAETDCEEQGPATFPVHEVHKIAQVRC